MKELTKQYFTVVLFIILYKFVPAFDSVDEPQQKAAEFHWLSSVAASYYTAAKEVIVAIQIKTTEQYFPAVLFILLCKVVLAFELVDKSSQV